jgi:hypothetical protein
MGHFTEREPFDGLSLGRMGDISRREFRRMRNVTAYDQLMCFGNDPAGSTKDIR